MAEPNMVEHLHHVPLAPLSIHVRRLTASIVKSGLLIVATLGGGMAGYHWIANMNWLDSLLNASMILGGMGPVDDLTTPGAKLFAALYALFCGLVFVVAMGVVLGPILHRMLHRFHLDDLDDAREADRTPRHIQEEA
jgi:hypothetical protein